MKQYEDLGWDILETKTILKTPVFDVITQKERSKVGIEGEYIAIDTVDWVVIIPVHEDKFVLVKQFRHGEGRITLEFPGGSANQNEDPGVAAARELEEETGYKTGKLTFLGKVSSNPAIFRNHFAVYLAEDLVQTGERHLDADEVLNYEERPIEEVVAGFGNEEYTHAYMGTALAFYFRHLKNQGK